MHVWLELTNALRTEGVRYNLALASMLCTVAGIEKTTLDGDEGIVVLAKARLLAHGSSVNVT